MVGGTSGGAPRGGSGKLRAAGESARAGVRLGDNADLARFSQDFHSDRESSKPDADMVNALLASAHGRDHVRGVPLAPDKATNVVQQPNQPEIIVCEKCGQKVMSKFYQQHMQHCKAQGGNVDF